jgi:small-conductance mechanosensitive channel
MPKHRPEPGLPIFFIALLMAAVVWAVSISGAYASESGGNVRLALSEITAQSATPPSGGASGTPDSPTMAGTMSNRLMDIRRHLWGLAAELPRLPSEIADRWNALSRDVTIDGILMFVLRLMVLIAAGYCFLWLYWRATKKYRTWASAVPLTTQGERLLIAGGHLIYGVGYVAAFAIGCIAAFLLIPWSMPLREIVLAFLMAGLAVFAIKSTVSLALAPGGRALGIPVRLPLIPMSQPLAVWWVRRLVLAAGWFFIGWAIVMVARTAGLSREGQQIIAYTLGLGLLAIGLELAWRKPHQPDSAGAPQIRRFGPHAISWAITFVFVALWLAWVISAMKLFWLLALLTGFPFAMRISQRAVNTVLSPDDTPSANDNTMPSMAGALADRAIRMVLILVGIILFVRIWHSDFSMLMMSDSESGAARIFRGILIAIAILLVAECVWHMTRTAIDLTLARATRAQNDNSEGSQRYARLRTLLPILRNMLMITIAAMGILMALASLGVQIAPLIAGAGVVGVAIGFGSQALVKDVISGMFYLLDDAFRVGEYIETGRFKGTVESFSLRSVRLRHHNGPIFTVPFGELGAVQNMSRDWVIEKLVISITYDSDIQKAREIIGEIGQELLKTPSFAKSTIEPLKMQGVENFGDFAVQLSCKMKTKAREQFAVRRRALELIKVAFDANGIKFAYPTVQIAGGAGNFEAAAAAAQSVVKTRTAAGEANVQLVRD